MVKAGILNLLKGGDRRSTGQSDRVVAMVGKNPSLLPDLIAGIWSDDPLVRMRAADAAEKVTRRIPELLIPYADELLGLMQEATEKELRWHLAAMAPRLANTRRRRRLAWQYLSAYLNDRSSIVRTFALQGMTELAMQDETLREEIIQVLEHALRTGSAAIKARSRKLLKELEPMSSSR